VRLLPTIPAPIRTARAFDGGALAAPGPTATELIYHTPDDGVPVENYRRIGLDEALALLG